MRKSCSVAQESEFGEGSPPPFWSIVIILSSCLLNALKASGSCWIWVFLCRCSVLVALQVSQAKRPGTLPRGVGRGLGCGTEELSAQSQATSAYATIIVINVSKTQRYFQVDWKKNKNYSFQFYYENANCYRTLWPAVFYFILFFSPGMDFYTKARKDAYSYFECASWVKWLIECCESKGLHPASPAQVCGSLFLPEGKHSTADIFW